MLYCDWFFHCANPVVQQHMASGRKEVLPLWDGDRIAGKARI
jgi:hypothetical protein